ncbi:MAG: metallophosphoesterase [Planctomycetia bacterium]|nr:metallophosphoesterase [Planctomycetia bacterium]
MLDAPLLCLAFVGHLTLWVALYNQLHGRAIPWWLVHKTNLPVFLFVGGLPIYVGWWYMVRGGHVLAAFDHGASFPAVYLACCVMSGAFYIIFWLVHLGRPPLGTQLSNHTTHLNLLAELGPRYDGPRWTTMLARLPGNQILELSVHEKEIEIPRLPPELDGLSIAHLSDLHFTGRVGKAWFEEVVRRVDAMQPDLIAVTGDLIDREHTFPWIADTLGQLKARYGVYFVLGNHDLRVDSRQVRKLVEGCGLVDLGSRWLVREIRGQQVVLAGNELPWFSPAADLSAAPPRQADSGPLRIVLSHSPDQLHWARRNDVDLIMAGHTHGGQFRLPVIGATVTSSLIGSRFAAGTYYVAPTVMHVSRGLSGTIMFRINCPPELTRLVLRCPRAEA